MTIAAEAFLDTNVLVYATDLDSPYFRSARTLFNDMERTYAISPQILFEFMSVVTNPRRVRTPLSPGEANEVLKAFLSRPNLNLLPIDGQTVHKALSLALKYKLIGPKVFDALVAGVMLRYKIPVIITANVKHFQPFGFTIESISHDV